MPAATPKAAQAQALTYVPGQAFSSSGYAPPPPVPGQQQQQPQMLALPAPGQAPPAAGAAPQHPSALEAAFLAYLNRRGTDAGG